MLEEQTKKDDVQIRAKERERQWSEEISALNEKSAGTFFNIAGWAVIIASVLLGLVFGDGIFLIITTVLSYGSIGIVILGIGEILNFLYKIYINTKK